MRIAVLLAVLFGSIAGAQAAGVNNPPFWVQKMPLASPSDRTGAAMAYDAAHGQLVLFGGFRGSVFFSDTWVWDGTNWTQKTTTAGPSGRTYHAMAYDAAHGQVVLFGGLGYNANYPADTWVWDTWVWTHGIFASAGQPQSTPVSSAQSGYRYLVGHADCDQHGSDGDGTRSSGVEKPDSGRDHAE